jgi:hypothetical protein
VSDYRTVVQGGYGPVPMAENGRRYINSEPVTVDLGSTYGSYYMRRLMSGELVEYMAPVEAPPLKKVSEK